MLVWKLADKLRALSVIFLLSDPLYAMTLSGSGLTCIKYMQGSPKIVIVFRSAVPPPVQCLGPKSGELYQHAAAVNLCSTVLPIVRRRKYPDYAHFPRVQVLSRYLQRLEKSQAFMCSVNMILMLTTCALTHDSIFRK